MWGTVSQGSPLFVAMIKIKTKRQERPRKVFYVCNRKRCENCTPYCHHTLDIEYALYKEHTDFDLGPEGSLWEK